jgi:hypothetical protein
VPAGELGKVVRSHDPDESRAGKAAAELGQGVRRPAGAERGFDPRRDQAASVGKARRGGEAFGEGRHVGAALQRIAGRDHEPDLIEPQGAARRLRDVEMAFMRGVEAAAEQADAERPAVAEAGQPVCAQGRTWPVPTT